jgi:hypothetical protein
MQFHKQPTPFFRSFILDGSLAGCIFAANGVGCILAEVGDLTAAKEVFLQASKRDRLSSMGSTHCHACCLLLFSSAAPPCLLLVGSRNVHADNVGTC